MLITQVELTNTKSYRQQTVKFAGGTNAICGENGAGKTTLVEAIGFTLFDFLPNNQSSFVREGEKTATIAVTFVSGLDEREYQVVRRCGSRNDYYVYDPDIDGRLVDGKTDVTAWLRQHLGVEASTDLTSLFRDALGVPQGLLTAAFLEKPSQRKPVFDRLLQVDDYARVYADSRETVSYVKDQIGQAAARIAGLEAEVSRLPGLLEQVNALQQEITGLDRRRTDLAAELGQIGLLRQELETVAQNVISLTQEADRRRVQWETLTDKLVSAEKSAGLSRLAQAEQEQSQPGYDAYLAAQEAIEQLERERSQRDRGLAESVTLEKTLTRSQARVEQIEAELLAAADARQQLAELEPSAKEQADLETRRDQLRQAVVMLEHLFKQRANQQQEMVRLQEEMSRVENGLAEAGGLEKTQQADRQSLAETLTGRMSLEKTLSSLDAENNRLIQQAQALAQVETALCPVCEQPLTDEHRQRLLEENRYRQKKLLQQTAELQAETVRLEESAGALNRSIEAAARRLRQLPSIDDKARLEERLSVLSNKYQEIEAEISTLAGTELVLAQVVADLDRLGNPRRQYDLLTVQAAKESSLQEQLESEQQAVDAIETSLQQIKTTLAPFAGLDDRIARQRQELNQNLIDYQRFLSSSQVAAELPARLLEVKSLTGLVAEAKTQLAETNSRLEKVKADFDPAELERVRQKETTLGREQATLEGQLATLGRQLTYTGNEIAGLESKQVDLQHEQERQEKRRRVFSLIQIFRDIIREAGPHVIRRLAQRVSLQATRLYAAILADPTCRLIWREDYSIQMEKDGRMREFDMLSGGEQMAAALAIRLALLKELSAIDIAFFDEPTSNLDETRRENLAEQIAAIRNTDFSQVFVISHDDTFEQATDHIVRVIKENGESRVEQG